MASRMRPSYAGTMADDHRGLAQRLRALRDEAADRVAQFEAVTRELADARGDADTDDEHDPEGSTVSWERAAHQESTDAARAHLVEIDAAIARVDCGWDGRCLGCGRSIPAERLAARPCADRCVACASSRR